MEHILFINNCSKSSNNNQKKQIEPTSLYLLTVFNRKNSKEIFFNSKLEP